MTYQIRPMSLGELLDTGFRLLRNHFGILVGLAVVLYLPLYLLESGIEATFPPLETGEPDEIRTALVVMGTGLIAGLLWIGVVVPVSSAAITHAVAALYLGRRSSIGEALGVGWSIFMPLAGTTLLMMLIIMGGLLLLVVPGIYFMLAYALTWPVIVVERTFGMAALRRSRDLTRGSMLRVFGILLVSALLASVITGGAQLALGYVPVIGGLAANVAQAIGSAFSSILGVLLYFDIRCRKEAFDLELLAAQVEGQTPPAAVAPVAG